jgi:putative CocE/NonD family hydrolase
MALNLKIIGSVFVIGYLGLGSLASAQIHKIPEQVRQAEIRQLADIEKFVMVEMRDGVRLATDVYRPRNARGPLPTIFWRTPYNFSDHRIPDPDHPSALVKFAQDAVKNGYAFVVQNERGRFFSEGEWEVLGKPRTDGYDALSWIAKQPWSDGNVGTLGCSSTAEWQMSLAAMNHPAHKAAVPMAAGAGIGRVGPFYEQGNFYRGGAIMLPMASWFYGNTNNQRPSLPAGTTDEDRRRLANYYDLAAKMPPVDWGKAFWHLPIQDLMKSVDGPDGLYEKTVRRGPNHEDWYKGGLYHDNEDYHVPTLWMNSWYDLSVGPNLALFNHVSKNASKKYVRDNQYMVIAPTLHCQFYRLQDNHPIGERNLGNIDFGLDEMLLSFFDRYLKGKDSGFENAYPRIRYYAMGGDKEGEWRDASEWPPKDAKMISYYLDSKNGANSLFGDGTLVTAKPDARDQGFDDYTYDPTVPVPAIGGNFCCMDSAVKPGAFDQRNNEARQDVLVYTSGVLEHDVDVTGFIEPVLYVSSDAKDTDFTVKLVDVFPDGTAYNLDDTILRARYRDGFDKEVLMEEGKVYRLNPGPLATSNVFKKGHKIRIEVSSSSFPHYDRNLNTGGKNFDETEPVTAHNRIHHSSKYPSHVKLPVRLR